MVNEKRLQAEALLKMLRQRLDADSFCRVMARVKYIDAVLFRIEIGVMRPFAGQKCVNTFRLCPCDPRTLRHR